MDDEVVEELFVKDKLVDPHDYAEEAINMTAREVLENVLKTLPVVEAEVLRLRFGFYDNHPKTIKEVGKELGLGEKEVFAIENRGLRKLRKPNIAMMIKDYYYDSETEKYGR